MRTLFPLLLLFLSLHIGFVSCTSPQERRRMASIIAEADSMNRHYAPMTSDSLLLLACRYYDRHGTPNERMRAHYLLGCAYRDMGEAPQALECYQGAIACADTTASDCNYRLMMSINGQMGILFHSQNLPDDEIEVINSARRCAILAKDTFGYIRSYEMLMRPYYLLGDTDKVVELINKGRQLYKKYGYPLESYNSYSTLIYISIQRGKLEEARKLMNEYESLSGLFDDNGNIGKGHEIYYYIKACYYERVGSLDSAEYMLRKLPAELRTDSYRGLLKVFQRRQQTDSICHYARLYEDGVDSLQNSRRTEIISRMASLYNYHRYRIEAETARATSANERAYYSRMLFLLAVLLLVLSFIMFSYRMRTKKKLEQSIRLMAEYERIRVEYDLQKERLDRLVTSNEHVKQEHAKELFRLQAQITDYEQKIKTMNQKDKDTLLKHSNVVAVFREKARYKKGQIMPTESQWHQLERQFEFHFPNIYSAIQVLAPQEIKACMLLFLNFSGQEIAVLMEVSEQRVTNIKSRINRKLFGDNSATTLQRNLKAMKK